MKDERGRAHSRLTILARSDDPDAQTSPFEQHRYAAWRLARHLGIRDDAETVVATAFTQALGQLRGDESDSGLFRHQLFALIGQVAAQRGLPQEQPTVLAARRRLCSTARPAPDPCRVTRLLLPRLVQGIGGGPERRQAVEHLDTCSDCAVIHADLQATGGQIGITSRPRLS